MTEALWKPGRFLVAECSGVREIRGFLHGGLGMYKTAPGSPKGRRPPAWWLVHLGSGHGVCSIHAHMAEAFGIATETAALGDWDFDGFYGYRNRDPELPARLAAFLANAGKKVRRDASAPGREDLAREIAMARA